MGYNTTMGMTENEIKTALISEDDKFVRRPSVSISVSPCTEQLRLGRELEHLERGTSAPPASAIRSSSTSASSASASSAGASSVTSLSASALG